MNWLVLVGITVITSALSIFIDNYVSDFYFKGKDANAHRLFTAPACMIVAVVFLCIGGFDFLGTDPKALVMFFISGLLLASGSIPYFKALEIDNSTNLSIFIQLTPVLYLIFGWLFLGDSLSIQQLLAFFIILAAPFLIIFTTKKRSRSLQIRAITYTLIYVVIKVLGNLIFVKENVAELSFLTEMGFVFLGKGVANYIIMYTHPKWRKRYHYVVKRNGRKIYNAFSWQFAMGVIKNLIYQIVLIVAPTTALASATMDSILPIAVFFMGIVLTIVWPKFGREKLNRKMVMVHLVATVLVAIGIVLIQN